MAQEERKLRMIPLGGMGEIGKNMFAFEYEDEILLVDGGLAFPDTDMLGVDIIVPKIDWVVENSHKIKGWVLTHGHEDHIGGVPYLLRERDDIPLMPSLRDLLTSEELSYRTLFSVVPDEEAVDRVIAATEAVVGDLSLPNSGFLFVVPVSRAVGLQNRSRDSR